MAQQLWPQREPRWCLSPVGGSAQAVCWAQPHRAPRVSAGDLPLTTVPPTTTTTTPRAPPRNVGIGRADAAAGSAETAELPPEWGDREGSPLRLLYGVKSCLWKGNKSLTSFERQESVTSPVRGLFPSPALHGFKQFELWGELGEGVGTDGALLPFSRACVQGKVLIFAEPC